jgi:hypothetical protein
VVVIVEGQRDIVGILGGYAKRTVGRQERQGHD